MLVTHGQRPGHVVDDLRIVRRLTRQLEPALCATHRFLHLAAFGVRLAEKHHCLDVLLVGGVGDPTQR